MNRRWNIERGVPTKFTDANGNIICEFDRLKSIEDNRCYTLINEGDCWNESYILVKDLGYKDSIQSYMKKASQDILSKMNIIAQESAESATSSFKNKHLFMTWCNAWKNK